MPLLFLLACENAESPNHTNKGNDEASSGCESVGTPVAASEISPLGFAPDDVLAWLAGTHTTSLTFVAENTTHDLQVTVAATGTASLGIDPVAIWGEGELE